MADGLVKNLPSLSRGGFIGFKWGKSCNVTSFTNVEKSLLGGSSWLSCHPKPSALSGNGLALRQALASGETRHSQVWRLFKAKYTPD